MADFSTLIASIEETIKTNGVQAITGQILQDEMLLMVSAINQLKQDTLEGYAFYGQAFADGGSASVTQNTFFLVGRGTYTINGNSVTIANAGVSVIVYDSVAGSVTSAPLFPYDETPTLGSENAITSGAVAAAIAEIPANFAACLYDRRSAGTPQSPYTFRQSGGDGVDYLKRIKGRTLVWNQLFNADSATRVVAGISLSFNNGRVQGTGVASVVTTGSLFPDFSSLITGHTYFIGYRGSHNNCAIRFYSGTYTPDLSGDVIVTATANTNVGVAIRTMDTTSTVSVDVYLMCIDLTLLGWVPSTAEEFRAVYPLSYYAYTPALMKNNAATDLESTGFNQWDEVAEEGNISTTDGQDTPFTGLMRTKNYIRVIPGGNYYFRISAAQKPYRLYYYNAAKNYLGYVTWRNSLNVTIPSDTYYIRFVLDSSYGTTYNHDICINLSDADRNGTYEPYWKATRHLGLDSFEATDGENVITVNGLKSAGSVYDEIIEGKKFVKRIETRAYQSGDENDSAVTTDGTNTNYALATPKEYELVKPIQPMLEVDELGTERRLPEDTADAVNAPFESDSNYSVSVANLVRKLSE